MIMGVHKTTEHESGYFEDEDEDAMGVCGPGRRAGPAAAPMSTCDALNNNVPPGHDCCHAVRPAIDRGESGGRGGSTRGPPPVAC